MDAIVVKRYIGLVPKRKLDPLPTAAFHILLSLFEGELHGYAIMRRVCDDTVGKVRLGPATLYGSIRTLLEAGLVEEVAERTDPELGNERRRFYRITAAGRRVARREAKRFVEVLRLVKAKRILSTQTCP